MSDKNTFITLRCVDGFIDTRQFLTPGSMIRTKSPNHFFFYEIVENDSIHIKLKFIKVYKKSKGFPKPTTIQRSF